MSKASCIGLMIVLGVLASLIDSISYTLSVLSDGVFIGLMIAVVWFGWQDTEKAES